MKKKIALIVFSVGFVISSGVSIQADEAISYPILDQSCIINSGGGDTCKAGFACSEEGYCEPKKQITSLGNQPGSCSVPTSGSSVFGNVACNSCPCAFELSMGSGIRRCDIIIPAIVSLDGTTIYGQGPVFQIPYDYGGN